MLHVSGQSSGQTFLKKVGSEFATWVSLQIMKAFAQPAVDPGARTDYRRLVASFTTTKCAGKTNLSPAHGKTG
jgi:hypothetical protein